MNLHPPLLQHTNLMAATGMLQPEVINRRRRRNKLTIVTTCAAWIFQLLANILLIGFVFLIFGQNKFLHSVLAILSASLNFTILPMFFILVSDEKIKAAFLERNYRTIFKLCFEFWSFDD